LSCSEKDPVFGIELINRISGKTLFEDGVYNFSSLFEYAKQLSELIHISAWYLDDKRSGKRFELLKPRLFYATVEVLSSIREIQYRVNCIDTALKASMPLKINAYDVADDAIENITKQCLWFAREFLDNNPFHQEFFSGVVNWSGLFRNDLANRETFEPELTKQLTEYVKTHLFSIVHREVISKGSSFGDRLFSLLEPFFGSINRIKAQTDTRQLAETVASISDRLIFTHFEHSFLPVLNLVYSEVFHPLMPFTDLTFITKDWKKLQVQLIKRFNEGHRYGAITLDNNGNLSVGILPEEFRYLAPIENPEEEVFILTNNSGIITTLRSTWEDVKTGKVFK